MRPAACDDKGTGTPIRKALLNRPHMLKCKFTALRLNYYKDDMYDHGNPLQRLVTVRPEGSFTERSGDVHELSI